MKLIEVTNADGLKFYLNSGHIISVHSSEVDTPRGEIKGSRILLSNGKEHIVQEDPRRIQGLSQ